MPDKLGTRSVFVDTSVFVSQNFAFGGKRFSRLKDLCQQDELRLILTDVTVREIEARIDEKINVAVRALRAASSEARILKALDIPGLAEVFSKIDKGGYKDALKERFRDFREEAGSEVVKVDGVRAGPIFNLYFAGKPPFGEGKKKDEFPDAFALAAILGWSEREGEKIYVVSEDNGMKATCEGSKSLMYLAELDKLFELVLKEEGLTEHLKEAHMRFAGVADEVRQKAKAALEKDLFMYLMDQEGEAQRARVKDVHLGEESVVFLSDAQADYALTAEISFEADVRYADPDFTAYDAETGNYMYFDFIEETLYRTLEVSLDVSLRFDPADPQATEVTEFIANDGDALWINVEEDGWPYK